MFHDDDAADYQGNGSRSDHDRQKKELLMSFQKRQKGIAGLNREVVRLGRRPGVTPAMIWRTSSTLS